MAESQADRARFARNTGFSLFHQLLTMVLALALVPYLIWQIGAERYGLWLILQIFNIFGLVSLAELGFQGAIIRYLVRHREQDDPEAFARLLATSVALFTAIGLLAAAAVFWFARTAFLDVFSIPPAMEDEARLALSVYAAGLLVAFPMLAVKAFYSGVQDVAALKIWEMSDRTAFAIGIALVVLVSDNLLYMVLVEQAVMVLAFATFAWRARRRYPRWFRVSPRKVSRASLDGVLGMTGMVFLTNLSNLLYVRAPEAVVGAVLGPVALAQFTIATRIPRVMKTIQGALNAGVLPHAALLDSRSEGSDAKRQFALRGMRLSYLVFVPMAMLLIVFAEDILRLWVGNRFAGLAPLMAVATIWQLAAILVSFGSATFTSAEHYRRAVWRNLAINALFLAALVPAIARFGLPGAFAALLVANLATMAVMYVATRAANGFSHGEFLRRVVAGPVILSAALGLLAYGAAKLVLGWEGTAAGLAALAAAGLAYLAAWYLVLLDATERSWLRTLLAKALRLP